MIEAVEGTIIEQAENHLLLQIGPLTLKINFLRKQGILDPGKKVRFFTHFFAHEDQFILFGFLKKEELETFRELLKVNGIGPRLAQSIVAQILPGELKEAVEHNNPVPLLKVPGVGRKTALKILLALQGKNLTLHFPGKEWEEALEALINLGFERGEALEKLNQVNLKKGKLNVAEIIKEALKS
ncbi:MAG: Holliday junction branch migration protein RuvA [bacterium]